MSPAKIAPLGGHHAATEISGHENYTLSVQFDIRNEAVKCAMLQPHPTPEV
jgi:hypothetical protein